MTEMRCDVTRNAMAKMAAPVCDVYVGAETGFLKGVNFGKKCYVNLNALESANRDREILAMCWDSKLENKIVFGTRDRLISTYDTKTNVFSSAFHVSGGEGPLKGIDTSHGSTVTCVQSGHVKVWRYGKEKGELFAGPNIHRMRKSPYRNSVIATGGKENDLAIWDLNRPDQPIFKARNVSHDFLNLRVPVWVTDMRFVEPQNTIVACTGHHHIRLYDPRAQRRPMVSVEFDEYPITSMDLAARDHCVVVGNARGRMALFDLRNVAQVGRDGMVHCYRGYFAGSIRNIECHPTLDLVASCGLDRFLRVHDVNTRVLLHKVYLKSRLNCLLIDENWDPMKETGTDGFSTAAEEVEEDFADKEQDDMWDQMEPIGDEKVPAKRKQKLVVIDKKHLKRPKSVAREGNT